MKLSQPFIASFGLLALAVTPALALPLPAGNSYSAAHAVAGPQAAGGARQTEASASHQTPFVRGDAHASLRTGTLKALAWSSDTASPSGCSMASPDCRWGTSATAAVWDVLLLQRNGSTATQVPWSFHIDGRSDTGPWWGETSASAYIYLGNNETMWRNPTRHVLDGDDTVSGSISVTGDSAWVYVYAGLEVSAGQGAWTDYSHTMQFDWQLPEGWTLWSQSGQFMAGTPVPEPGSGALLAGGGALLAWLTRRRRSLAVPA